MTSGPPTNCRHLPNGPFTPSWLSRFARDKKVIALIGPPRSGKTSLVRRIVPALYLSDPQELPPSFPAPEGPVVLDRNCRVYLPANLGAHLSGALLPHGLILVGTKPSHDDWFTIQRVGIVPGLDLPLTDTQVVRFWLRGGLPESYFAPSDAESLAFRRWYLDYYNHEELSQLWDLVLHPEDGGPEHRLPWDSGLHLTRSGPSEGLFANSGSADGSGASLAWESCVARLLEGTLSLIDPIVQLYRRAVRGLRLFVCRSGAFRVAFVPLLREPPPRLPLQRLDAWLREQGLERAYLIRPTGPAHALAGSILWGGFAALLDDLRQRV